MGGEGVSSLLSAENPGLKEPEARLDRLSSFDRDRVNLANLTAERSHRETLVSAFATTNA
jgi:hypothetical protein